MGKMLYQERGQKREALKTAQDTRIHLASETGSRNFGHELIDFQSSL